MKAFGGLIPVYQVSDIMGCIASEFRKESGGGKEGNLSYLE